MRERQRFRPNRIDWLVNALLSLHRYTQKEIFYSYTMDCCYCTYDDRKIYTFSFCIEKAKKGQKSDPNVVDIFVEKTHESRL